MSLKARSEKVFTAFPFPQSSQIPRLPLLLLLCLLVAVPFLNGCRNLVSSADYTIPRLLLPLSDSTYWQLLDRLKPFTDINGLRSTRVLMQFLDAETSRRFNNADASLVLQRPDKILLLIQDPVLGSRIADMASEGNKFRVAIYKPSDRRRFLIGTNDADYSRMRSKLSKNEQSGLINARPFHFTDALMMRPLKLSDPKFAYSLEETLLEENDTQKDAKKGARVWRSFYVISELELPTETGRPARVLRRFWFDRTQNSQFARQQLLDARSQVVTEVRYLNFTRLSDEEETLWPGVIEVSRPKDGYIARLTFGAGEYKINPDFGSARPFLLENKEGLPETDLDQELEKTPKQPEPEKSVTIR
jgi:hypothetical protein